MSDLPKIQTPKRGISPEAEKLLGEVNEHLRKHPMGRAYFALNAAGYSTWLSRLEAGFSGKEETRKRVRAFMRKRETPAKVSQ